MDMREMAKKAAKIAKIGLEESVFSPSCLIPFGFYRNENGVREEWNPFDPRNGQAFRILSILQLSVTYASDEDSGEPYVKVFPDYDCPGDPAFVISLEDIPIKDQAPLLCRAIIECAAIMEGVCD